MHRVDISPRPMMSVDILLESVAEQLGISPFCATSTVRAYAPFVTGQRHATVSAVSAASIGVVNPPALTSLGSALIGVPVAVANQGGVVPVVTSGATVNALIASSSTVARAPNSPSNVSVTAVKALGGTTTAPIPVIFGESVLTGGGPGSATWTASVPVVSVSQAPQFGSIGSKVANFGTSVAIPVPASTAVNDIVIAVLYVQGTQTVTAPDGTWTQAPSSPQDMGGIIREHVWWKRLTAADSGTYTFTLASGVTFNGCAARYTQCVTTGSPFNVDFGAAIQASAYPNASLTTTVSNTLLVWAGIGYDGTDHPPGVTTPPSNMTTRLNDSTGETIAISDVAQTASGLSATFSASSTGNDKKCVWLGALKP